MSNFDNRCKYNGCRFYDRFARVETCLYHTVNPDRLQEPAVGTLVVMSSRYEMFDGVVARVVQQSYMWAPNDPAYGGGVINYGEAVVEYTATGKRVVVPNNTLTPVVLPKVGDKIK